MNAKPNWFNHEQWLKLNPHLRAVQSLYKCGCLRMRQDS